MHFIGYEENSHVEQLLTLGKSKPMEGFTFNQESLLYSGAENQMDKCLKPRKKQIKLQIHHINCTMDDVRGITSAAVTTNKISSFKETIFSLYACGGLPSLLPINSPDIIAHIKGLSYLSDYRVIRASLVSSIPRWGLLKGEQIY